MMSKKDLVRVTGAGAGGGAGAGADTKDGCQALSRSLTGTNQPEELATEVPSTFGLLDFRIARPKEQA